MELEQMQRAIEAILFAAGERIDIARLAYVLEEDPKDIEKAADELANLYAFERRGIRILKLEKGYQMVSSGEMADYVTKALETRKPPKLSASQLETLTIIAYYQPATKAMVEQIRGVDSAYWKNCPPLRRSPLANLLSFLRKFLPGREPDGLVDHAGHPCPSCDPAPGCQCKV